MRKLTIRDRIRLMPIVPYAVTISCGIFIGYFLSIPVIYALGSMVCCIISALFLHNSRNWRQIPLLIATVFLGICIINIHCSGNTDLFGEKAYLLDVVVEDTPKHMDRGLVVPCYIIAPKGDVDAEQVNARVAERKIRCTFIEPQFTPVVGQTLTIKGKLRKIVDAKQTNRQRSGNFNYQRWLLSRSFVGRIVVYRGNATPSVRDGLSELPMVKRVSVKARIIRQRVLSELETQGIGDSNEFAVISAMGFGEKSSLSKETRDVFSQTGVAHLLALSGMHLGILYILLMLLAGFVEQVFDSRFTVSLMTRGGVISTIWGYVMLVGMPQSVVRAAIMLTLYMAVSFASRARMAKNALAVTAIIMLIVNPMAIWDVGFQLSFFAMAGIFVFYTPFYNIIGDKFLFLHPILRKVWSLTCVSSAAQIATLPLSVYYFGRIPLFFLFTNLVAIPLVTLLLYSVFLSVVFWAIPFIRTLFLLFAELLVSLLTKFLGGVANWNIASINNISINWIQMMLIYLLIVIVSIFVVQIIRVARLKSVRHLNNM